MESWNTLFIALVTAASESMFTNYSAQLKKNDVLIPFCQVEVQTESDVCSSHRCASEIYNWANYLGQRLNMPSRKKKFRF